VTNRAFSLSHEANSKHLLPSLADTIFLSIFFVLILQSGHNLLNDGDTGYHVRAGELILEQRIIPKKDIFSFWRPPLSWTAHEWLSEVIMALIHKVSGLTGIVVFFSFMIASTHLLLFKILSLRSSAIVLPLLISLLVAVCSTAHWLARPHIFSLTLTLIWCQVLDTFQYRGKNRLVLLPLLMLLWVNLHAGFILGIVIIAIYLAGNVGHALSKNAIDAAVHWRMAKQLALCTIVCLGASMLNPGGLSILFFPFQLTSDVFLMDHVQEFLSPNFHDPLPFKYLLLLLIGVLALSRTSVNFIELGLILLFTYMALYSARHITLFTVTIAPILQRLLYKLSEEFPARFQAFVEARFQNIIRLENGSKPYVWSALGVVAAAVLGMTGFLQFSFNEKSFPISAVEFLKREQIRGNMFNSDAFGDYIIYAAWPQYKVFIDGRSDMYGTSILKEYLTVVNVQPGWEKVLEKYDIGWIIFDAESALSAILRQRRDWQLLYGDKVANIFVKSDLYPQTLTGNIPDTTRVRENDQPPVARRNL
jgi:hypothetical protein